MPTFSDTIGSDGALVRVEVGISRMFRRGLLAAGQPIPQPRTVTALLDTGAEVTCVDPRTARLLQLAPAPNFGIVNAPSVGGLSLPLITHVRLTVLHPSGKPAHHLTVHDLPTAE